VGIFFETFVTNAELEFFEPVRWRGAFSLAASFHWFLVRGKDGFRQVAFELFTG
jgi:hypothetical protein